MRYIYKKLTAPLTRGIKTKIMKTFIYNYGGYALIATAILLTIILKMSGAIM